MPSLANAICSVIFMEMTIENAAKYFNVPLATLKKNLKKVKNNMPQISDLEKDYNQRSIEHTYFDEDGSVAKVVKVLANVPNRSAYYPKAPPTLLPIAETKVAADDTDDEQDVEMVESNVPPAVNTHIRFTDDDIYDFIPSPKPARSNASSVYEIGSASPTTQHEDEFDFLEEENMEYDIEQHLHQIDDDTMVVLSSPLRLDGGDIRVCPGDDKTAKALREMEKDRGKGSCAISTEDSDIRRR